jgi:hypothetical protein
MEGVAVNIKGTSAGFGMIGAQRDALNTCSLSYKIHKNRIFYKRNLKILVYANILRLYRVMGRAGFLKFQESRPA